MQRSALDDEARAQVRPDGTLRLRQWLRRAGVASALANSGWMMGEQAARLVVGVGISIWIARHLGPVDFGRLSFAVSYVSLFAIVATLGLNRILVRELVRVAGDAEAASNLIRTVFRMRLMAAAGLYVLAVALASWTSESDVLLVALVAGGLFFSASDCIDLYFQSRTQSRVTASARMVSFGAATLVRLVLLVAGADVQYFAAAALLELLFGAVALQRAYRRAGAAAAAASPRFDGALSLRLVRESWPEILAGFTGLLFMRLDQVMLHELVGPEAVGTYAVAAKLSEFWYFVPAAIVASTFPAVVRQQAVNRQRYLQRIGQLMAALVALSYAAIIVGTAAATPLVKWLYGEAYAGAGPILVVHVWCGLFMCLGIASGSWIMAERRAGLNLLRNLLGAALNIALNFVLIPPFQGMGAAVATLVAFASAYLLFDMLVPSMREMRSLKLQALVLWPILGRR